MSQPEKRKVRYFNTTGPCNPEEHYMLDTEEGLEQIKRYRDKVDQAASAYLVIFDRRPETRQKPWDERLIWLAADDRVTIVVC